VDGALRLLSPHLGNQVKEDMLLLSEEL